MKLDFCWGGAESFLEKVFLRLAFIILVLLFGLPYFFQKVAFTVTMQPGFIPVFAKFGCNVISVQLETRVDKQARKVDSDQCNN